MNKIDKEIDVFITEIKKNLVCDNFQKRKIVNDIKNSILDFVSEHNTTDINDIYIHFGKPEEIAKQVIIDIDPKKIKNATNIRKILIITAIIIILMIAISLIFALVDAHKDYSGYGVESTVSELCIRPIITFKKA